MAEYRAKFINPYNFVPLGKECNKNSYEKGSLCGVIEYSLLTKTPLFIPDTETEQVDANGHREYKFFSYGGDKPVIPGSEMRGMLRSYYEILTDSCLSALNMDKILSKRTSEVYKPGLIKKCKNGEEIKYELLSARDCLLRTDGENSLNVIEKPSKKELEIKSYKQSELSEGQKVYILYETRKDKKGNFIKPIVKKISKNKSKDCRREAYIIKGEAGPEIKDKKDKEKHCCHVFMLDNRCKEPIAQIAIEKLQQAIDLYQTQNNGAKSYEEYKIKLKEYIGTSPDNSFFPVYYSIVKEKDNSIVMLSPASITREVYHTKISKLIGSYEPCIDENCLCSTCKLFGMLNNSRAVTSRIRVTDMEHKKSEMGIYDNIPWTLKPLSTPRLQNIEFYMKKPVPNAWFWTYDYYVDDHGNLHINDKPEINGRKFFWHHPNVYREKVTTSEKDIKNITVTPVKEGNLFKGKIYFDNLTKEELTSLVYLLNAGETVEITKRTHGYKLGYAKPFGLGSVAICVNSIVLRGIRRTDGNIEIKDSNKTSEYGMESKIINEECKKNMAKITDFSAINVDENIAYPISNKKKGEEKDEGYAWFVDNHMAYRYNENTNKKEEYKFANKRTQMIYKEYMQPMTEKLVFVDEEMMKLKEGAEN